MNPARRADKVKLVEVLNKADLDPKVEVVIAPPTLYLIPVAERLTNTQVKVSAQNCYFKDSGAFTGEISPAQLADTGIPYVILGHSERRSLFHESSAEVAQKTAAALQHGLKVILCCGETLEEREADKTLDVVQEQVGSVVKALKPEDWTNVVIAYEPVWAIGTGKVATSQQAQDVHAALRSYLSRTVSPEVAEKTRIIYGGSVNASNCGELATQPDIDGFLVGGASLKPEFIDIINVNKGKSA